MLNQTSETAVKALIFIGMSEPNEIVTPREIAPKLGASPTYLAKITRMLVKADILVSHRGVNGGVSLIRDPASISLLEITEACQGLLVGNYCRSMEKHVHPVCAFHQSMQEIHEATMNILKQYSLANFLQTPKEFDESFPVASQCKMAITFPEPEKVSSNSSRDS